MTPNDADSTRQIDFELEKAEHGMALPYDAERVGQLRKMLVEARKRKLSQGLARRLRQHGTARRDPLMPLTCVQPAWAPGPIRRSDYTVVLRGSHLP